MPDFVLANNGVWISPCFAEYRRYPGRGYHLGWKTKLNKMTKGNHLEDAYDTTLALMKAQEGSRSRLGMEALMWVSHSERLLHTSELCHALGVRIGSPDLSIESILIIRTLLACSWGLITVEATSSTVRLVHFELGSGFVKKPLASSAWCGLLASGFFITNFIIFIGSYQFACIEILVHIYRF